MRFSALGGRFLLKRRKTAARRCSPRLKKSPFRAAWRVVFFSVREPFFVSAVVFAGSGGCPPPFGQLKKVADDLPNLCPAPADSHIAR